MTEISETALRVFSVASGNGNDEDWFEIGAAFPRSDGVGYDILLRAQPLTTKLVLRPVVHTTPREESDLCLVGEQPRPSLSELVGAFERALIERCLTETGGKIDRVMERLNIPRRTLSEKMVRYGISRQHFVSTRRRKSADEVNHTEDRPPIHRASPQHDSEIK